MKQPDLYTRAGERLAPEQINQAIEADDLAASPGAEVYVRVDGQLGTVPAEGLADALANGATLEDQGALTQEADRRELANRSTLEHVNDNAVVATKGLMAGASFGVNEIFETYDADPNLARYNAAQLQKQKGRAMPGVAEVSEVVGAAAPAILSGGASLAARAISKATIAGLAARVAAPVEHYVAHKLAAKLGTSMVGRMTARAGAYAAGGVVDGAILGSTTAVKELVAKGEEITAHKILIGAEHGALIGAALGGAIGAAGPLLGAARSKLAGAAADFAEQNSLKSIGVSRKALGESAGEITARSRTLGAELLDYRFQSGPMKGRKLFTGAKSPTEIIDDLQFATQETADSLIAAGKRLDAVAATRPDLAPTLGNFLKRVDAELIEPLAQMKPLRSKSEGLRLARELEPLRAFADQPATFSNMQAIRASLLDSNKPALSKAAGMLGEELDVQASRLLEGMGQKPTLYKELSQTHENLDLMRRLASDPKVAAKDGSTLGVVTALAAFATGGVGAIGSMLSGAALTGARSLLASRGSVAMTAIANSVGRADAALTSAAQALARVGTKEAAPITVASRKPNKGAIARDVTEKSTAAHGHTELHAASQQPAQPAPKAQRARFDEAVQAVESAASNPEALARRVAEISKPFVREYPAVAGAVQQTLLADVAYLQRRLPMPATNAETSLTPFAKGALKAVPKAQQKEFLERVRALAEPRTVLDEIARGNFPAAALETLKERRPGVFEELRLAIMTETAQRKEALPYARRVLLSLAFDFKGDWSLENLPAIQSSFAPSEAPPEEGAPGDGATLPATLGDSMLNEQPRGKQGGF
jgi:hypothetical protein